MSLKQPHDDKPKCGSTKSRGRGLCLSIILGPNGRCRAHGGFGSGAPAGNKNAVTTGEHEAIYLDHLEPEEVALIARIDLATSSLLEDEIRLASIRERRMLGRIAVLKAKGEMTVVEVVDEQSTSAAGPVISIKTKSESTLNQIQRIEDALTRVQGHKAKLIELKHKLESDAKGVEGDDALTGLVQALKASRERTTEENGNG